MQLKLVYKSSGAGKISRTFYTTEVQLKPIESLAPLSQTPTFYTTEVQLKPLPMPESELQKIPFYTTEVQLKPYNNKVPFLDHKNLSIPQRCN